MVERALRARFESWFGPRPRNRAAERAFHKGLSRLASITSRTIGTHFALGNFRPFPDAAGMTPRPCENTDNEFTNECFWATFIFPSFRPLRLRLPRLPIPSMHMRFEKLLPVLTALVLGFCSGKMNAGSPGTLPGSLDLSFNGTGQRTTDFVVGDDYGNAVAVQADGRIVVVGFATIGTDTDFAVARYNSDGTPDTTFNATGKVLTDIAGNGDSALGVAIQGDGKIVVAGLANDGAFNNFAVVRYNANGTLDTTFNGTGKVTTPFGTNFSIATSVVVQGDGKIVLAGYTLNALDFDFAVARYNANGSLDTTFNGSGKLLLAVPGTDDLINSMALQADGKIVLAGYSSDNAGTTDCVVARLNTNGTLDTTFNGTGKVTTSLSSADETFTSVAVQSDGMIVAAGKASNGVDYDFAVVRYTAAGALDTTFNGTGKVITAFGAGDDSISGVALQTDGKIVVAGTSLGGGGITFAVARYTGAGSLDTTFNGTGKTTIGFGATTNGVGGVALQSDGRIVVAGSVGTVSDFAVARLCGGDGATPLNTWRQTWYGTTSNSGNAADIADPYHTGVSNLLVFGLFGPAQNPALATTGMRPQPQFVGGNCLISFTQPAGVSGITYGAQWRVDLDAGTWLPVPDTGSGNVRTFSVPMGANTHLFMRLTATSP